MDAPVASLGYVLLFVAVLAGMEAVAWLMVCFPPAGRYLQRIIKAHLVHHKTTGKEGAVSFGFLWAPKK